MIRAENEVALVRVKDDRTKSFLQMKPIWMGMKHFNFKNVQLRVDAEGYEDLNGMDPDLLYHDEKSLREQGLREISRDGYPSPYGGTLYHDDALYRAAKVLRNVEGRNWELLQITLWEKMSEIFDMSEYHPRADERNHVLGRLISMQRLFIDAQNIMMHAKDQTTKDVQNATERLPRSYTEWVELQRELTGTVKALEM
jgi:hypothetical protein